MDEPPTVSLTLRGTQQMYGEADRVVRDIAMPYVPTEGDYLEYDDAYYEVKMRGFSIDEQKWHVSAQLRNDAATKDIMRLFERE